MLLGGSWPRKTSKKLGSQPLGPRNRCSGATGASRRLQERSGRPRDGSESAPGGLGTAPRALRQVAERLRERPRRPQNRPRPLRELSERLEERSGGLGTAPFEGGASKLLLSEPVDLRHSCSGSRGRFKMAALDAAQLHSKWAFGKACEEVVRCYGLKSTSFGPAGSVHVYARVHTSIYIYMHNLPYEKADAPWDLSSNSECP